MALYHRHRERGCILVLKRRDKFCEFLSENYYFVEYTIYIAHLLKAKEAKYSLLTLPLVCVGGCDRKGNVERIPNEGSGESCTIHTHTHTHTDTLQVARLAANTPLP